MKTRVLVVLMLLVANVALADHLGIYSDATGSSCQLAPGFGTTATVIHKFSAGTTSSIFGVSAANAPGSTIFAFNSNSQTFCCCPPCPNYYNGCVTGSIVVGTITAILGPTGYIEVVGAGNFPTGDFPVPLVANCNQGSNSATGGRGYLGAPGTCEPALPVDTSTWGSVKALYR